MNSTEFDVSNLKQFYSFEYVSSIMSTWLCNRMLTQMKQRKSTHLELTNTWPDRFNKCIVEHPHGSTYLTQPKAFYLTNA
jgi:hypothetical protein